MSLKPFPYPTTTNNFFINNTLKLLKAYKTQLGMLMSPFTLQYELKKFDKCCLTPTKFFLQIPIKWCKHTLGGPRLLGTLFHNPKHSTSPQ